MLNAEQYRFKLRHVSQGSTTSSHDPTDYRVIDEIDDVAWQRGSLTISLHDEQSLRRYVSSTKSTTTDEDESTSVSDQTDSDESTSTTSDMVPIRLDRNTNQDQPLNLDTSARMPVNNVAFAEEANTISWHQNVKRTLRMKPTTPPHRPARLDLLWSDSTSTSPTPPGKDTFSPRTPVQGPIKHAFLDAPLPLTPPQKFLHSSAAATLGRSSSRRDIRRSPAETYRHSPFHTDSPVGRENRLSSKSPRKDGHFDMGVYKSSRTDGQFDMSLHKSPRNGSRSDLSINHVRSNKSVNIDNSERYDMHRFKDRPPVLRRARTDLHAIPSYATLSRPVLTRACASEVSLFESDSDPYDMSLAGKTPTIKMFAKRFRKSSKSLFMPRNTNLALV